MDKKAYYYIDGYDSDDISDEYQKLIGPDNFECVITEPEDRTFGRDLSTVISELNKLYDENIGLKLEIKKLKKE